MKTYHPPMTGLELQMEEEMAREIQQTAQVRQPIPLVVLEPEAAFDAAVQEENDRKVEEAMCLHQ